MSRRRVHYDSRNAEFEELWSGGGGGRTLIQPAQKRQDDFARNVIRKAREGRYCREFNDPSIAEEIVRQKLPAGLL